MKRVINKNVLNGFLNQAVSHNKYLEESEMWKQKREREVSQERHVSRKRSSHSNERKSARHKSKSPAPKCSANKDKDDDDEIDDLKVLLALYKDVNKKSEEKWDHSGFMELYPNGVEDAKKPRTETKRRLSTDSSDHNRRSSSRKKSKHKRSHSKHKKNSSDS